MKLFNRNGFILPGLLLLSFNLMAETAYITDSVIIDVHSLQNEEGLVVTRLNSGTAVEILSKDGNYSHIKTSDDKKGWINSIHLKNEKPAAVEYLQLMGKYKSASKDLEEAYDRLGKYREMEKSAKAASFTKKELNKHVKKIKMLDTKLKARDAELQKASDTIVALRLELQNSTAPADENTTTEAAESQESVSSIFGAATGTFKVPFLWAIIAMIFSSILAFMGGMKWLDYRIRKRHGGVRIY